MERIIRFVYKTKKNSLNWLIIVGINIAFDDTFFLIVKNTV